VWAAIGVGSVLNPLWFGLSGCGQPLHHFGLLSLLITLGTRTFVEAASAERDLDPLTLVAELASSRCQRAKPDLRVHLNFEDLVINVREFSHQ
jgi:hypothetical protein